MASVGHAAAVGLDSGLRLGMGMRAQQNNEAQVKRQNMLQDDQLGLQREQLARVEDDRALAAIDQSIADLRAEGEGFAAQYGVNVPQEVAGPFKQRQEALSSQRNTLLRKRYEPIVQAAEQRAKDTAMALQSGRVQIDAVPPADLYDAIVVQTGRDPSDLIGTGGQPSRVATAVNDVMDGLEFKNDGAVLRGANVLFEPELKVGLGEDSPYGGKIVGKQIVKFIPHPTDPSKVLPVLKVYVSNGRAAPNAAPAEEGAPPGATGYYLAPVTQHRSSDPNDPPLALDLAQALDRAAQLQTLSTSLSHPAVAAKIEAGKKERGGNSDFLTAFYALRGKMPTKTVEYKSVKPGEKLVGIDTMTGRPTGDTIEGAPKKDKPTGLAANIAAVQDYAEENGISEAEAAIELQARGLLRPPKGAGKGSGAGGGSGGGAAREGLAGEELLATLGAEDRAIVKGLAEGTIKPETISTKGNRREHMVALAAQYMPDAAGGGGKPLPAAVTKQITEARDNAATIKRLADSFEDAYGGKGVLGLGGDKQMAASGLLGVDRDAVDWWKNYRKGAELIERHALFGAALTPTEQSSWRAADITPGTDAAVIRRNLQTRAALGAKVLDAARQDLIDAGHSEKRINAIAGRDMTVENLPPKEKPAAAAAAKPFRLPSDPKAAEAAYAKLAKGTKYIDPTGKQREKQ